MCLAEDASHLHDRSSIDRPSIATSEENDRGGWTLLIELNRNALDLLRRSDPNLASSLVGLWRTHPYPVFRRLVLYAAQHPELSLAHETVRSILETPESWFWASEVAVELLEALPSLWDQSSGDERRRLEDVIKEGPGRGLYPEYLSDPDWGDLRDHAIWQRLRAISEAGVPLSEQAAQEYRRLTEEHLDWAGPEADPNAARVTPYSADYLLTLSVEEAAELLANPDAWRSGLLNEWPLAAERSQLWGAYVLRELGVRGAWQPEVWYPALSVLARGASEEPIAVAKAQAVQCIPDEIARSSRWLLPVCRVIRAVASSNAAAQVVLGEFDRLIEASLEWGGYQAGGGRVLAAINHPAGVLCGSLLDVARVGVAERGSGLSAETAHRLGRAARAQGAGGDAVTTVLSLSLSHLHDLDPHWTSTHVIPMLDWAKPQRAAAAWDGFLRRAWVRPSLWEQVKSSFLGAFDHLDELSGGHPRRSLGSLVASTAVVGREGDLTAEESQRCLVALGPEGVGAAALWISEKMDSVGSGAPSLWRERVGPWLKAGWPHRVGLIDPAASEYLAVAAIRARDAFPDAVDEMSRSWFHSREAVG